MRIRSIKPEFWRSSDISQLSTEDRLLFIGLWSYVDDNGVGIDKLAAIAADLFADDIERDAQETFARVSRGLQNLAEAGRIARYAVQGSQYLSITNWGKHQRIDKPGKPRFPRQDTEVAEIRESVAEPPEVVAPVTGEQGNRGTGEQGSKTAPPATPSNAPKTPAEEIATYAYDSTSGALKYMAVKGLAKWAIENKQSTPDQIKASIRDLYEMGKPLTKATLGQHLDGHIKGSRTRPATENRMQDILAIGEHLDSSQQRQIGA